MFLQENNGGIFIKKLYKMKVKGFDTIKRLSSTAGTGDKIMSNLRLFSYNFDETKSDEDFYVFKVVFGNQEGYLNFRIENEEIIDVNLDVTGFSKTLGSNNDPSIMRVARWVYNSL